MGGYSCLQEYAGALRRGVPGASWALHVRMERHFPLGMETIMAWAGQAICPAAPGADRFAIAR